jgi:tRNA G37 N-methylase Trm5
LNPASYKYLCQNAQLNKCDKSLTAYNMDGRGFVLDLCDRQVLFDHAVMNLPQTATDFLDAFIGLAVRHPAQGMHGLPTVHVYAFSSEDDPVDDVRRRCAATMRIDETLLPLTHTSADTGAGAGAGADASASSGYRCVGHLVRDVAPKKIMVIC